MMPKLLVVNEIVTRVEDHFSRNSLVLCFAALCGLEDEVALSDGVPGGFKACWLPVSCAMQILKFILESFYHVYIRFYCLHVFAVCLLFYFSLNITSV